MNLNRLLASSCRRKILKALSANKEVNMMKLVRIVNSTYNEIDRNLRILENQGIITQRHFGHKRMISLNIENEKTLVLLKLLKIRDDSVDLKHFRRDLKRILENTKENNNCTKH